MHEINPVLLVLAGVIVVAVVVVPLAILWAMSLMQRRRFQTGKRSLP